MKRSLFERLEILGVPILKDEQFRDFFAVFDSESYQQQITDSSTGKLKYVGELIPASVACCSNIPGFEKAECFVSEGDPVKLGDQLIGALEKMQNEAARRNMDRYKSHFETLQAEVARLDALSRDETPSSLFLQKRCEQFKQVLERFKAWVITLPVFTFNGSRFDMNLLRKHMFPKLIAEKKIGHVIKKTGGYMSMRIGDLHFLDISNFLAAGTSYDQMLKAFKVSHEKFFWPYDWFTSLEQLEKGELPPQSSYFSRMKQKGISDEDYALVKKKWKELKWENMRDYLIFYNTQDVEPFVEAVEKMKAWWRGIGIDMTSQGVSLPTLALRHLHNNMQPGYVMPLVNEKNADLFWLMKGNVRGGPSVVFHRYHEKGKTNIRGNGRTCAGIRGLDCNGLYLWCTMQEMPVNVYYRWQKDANDDSFKRQNMYEKTLKETQWITLQEVKLGKRIFHRFNGDQVDLGCGGANGPFKKVPVDGFCAETNTVYQFYGCRWHGHGCHLDSGNDSKLLDYQTQRVHDYIISLGYKIEHIYECEFEKLMTDPTSDLCGFVRERYTLKFSGKTSATEQEILDAVRKGTFFGMCEVDIETPEALKDKFAEFQPIFKNKEVSRDDLTSDFMRQYAEDHGFLKRPQRMLLGSYTGEKTLLITPLLKWYMEHGLVVKKLYQAFQAVGSAQFAEVGESVAQARRDADADPQQKMRSEMSKTVGNCFYGRAITDITRHREVTFCGEGDVEKLMRDPRFSDLEPIDDHTYEVEMLKKKFVFDLPFMLGLFVYQYAKLRMEAFFHDFIAKYIPRECFELCQMDTDSFYMALAGDTFDELVPEQLMDAYMKEKYNWLPREDTPENRAFDKRTPGLFKVEWQGDGLISLTSKLYYGWSATDGPKIACKGVRRLNECISKANYERTLQTGEIISGTNDGFRMHGNVLKAYQQQKAAITGFYAKRPISADGVSTSACLL